MSILTGCDLIYDITTDVQPVIVDEDNDIVVEKFGMVDNYAQSMAVYGHYAFIVTKKLSSITMYDIINQKVVYTEELTPHEEKNSAGSNPYHCNQSSFGVEKFSSSDLFPILYISQRAFDDKRCFAEGYRIIPEMNRRGECVAFRTELMHTIYFPPMNKQNAMGNVNVVFDPERRKMFTYSRNNKSTDDNYLICRISEFDVPELNCGSTVLEDTDIIDSFDLDCSAFNMQGASIKNGHLYIGQGYETAGYIYLRDIDLNERSLNTYDLLASGIKWEPEGCAVYKDKLLIQGGRILYSFGNLFKKNSYVSRIKLNW